MHATTCVVNGIMIITHDLFAVNCTASQPACETIWNTDVTHLYRDLINGTLSRDRLQSFCRFWFITYSNWHLLIHITNTLKKTCFENTWTNILCHRSDRDIIGSRTTLYFVGDNQVPVLFFEVPHGSVIDPILCIRYVSCGLDCHSYAEDMLVHQYSCEHHSGSLISSAR